MCSVGAATVGWGGGVVGRGGVVSSKELKRLALGEGLELSVDDVDDNEGDGAGGGVVGNAGGGDDDLAIVNGVGGNPPFVFPSVGDDNNDLKDLNSEDRELNIDEAFDIVDFFSELDGELDLVLTSPFDGFSGEPDFVLMSGQEPFKAVFFKSNVSPESEVFFKSMDSPLNDFPSAPMAGLTSGEQPLTFFISTKLLTASGSRSCAFLSFGISICDSSAVVLTSGDDKFKREVGLGGVFSIVTF